MKPLLIVTLGAALAVSGCGTNANAKDPSLSPENEAAYRTVTIPAGTTLPLSLTSSVGSDTSAVEDTVTAELTRAITIDGRDVLPAGARLSGVVRDVDRSGRIRGRAMVAFRFTSLREGNTQYNVETASLWTEAPATQGAHATKTGIGAGAGAGGQQVRLGPGADVTTNLTVPLTVRVLRN